MDRLRAFAAALALGLLGAMLPAEVAAQSTPLQQLERLSDQARAADDAHAEAAKVCDREAMARHSQTLNRLARESRRVAEAARAAGEFATIDPETAARLAAIIATRARVAAGRQPENCGEREAARKEYFDKIESMLSAMESARLRGDCEAVRGLAEQAAHDITADRPIGYVDGAEADALQRRLREAQGRLCPPVPNPTGDPAGGGIRQQPPTEAPRQAAGQTQFEPPPPNVDRALTLNFEHAKAANRCDGPEMTRLLQELEQLAKDAEMEMHRWDSELTRGTWEQRSREYGEILKILEAARARQRMPCPRHRMPRIPQTGQQQQQQQPDPGARLFGRAFEQLLSPPGRREEEPVLGFPPLGTDRDSVRKDGNAQRPWRRTPAPQMIDDPDSEELIDIPDGGVTDGKIVPITRDDAAPPSRRPSRSNPSPRDRGRDFCDDGSAVSGEGDCDSRAQCAGGAVCVNDNGGRYGSTDPAQGEQDDHCAPASGPKCTPDAGARFLDECPADDASCTPQPDCSEPGTDPRRCSDQGPGVSPPAGSKLDCSQPGADPRRCPNEEPPPPQRTTGEEIEEYDRAIAEHSRTGSSARATNPPPNDPPPPPRPTASDQAPDGQEDRHPLTLLAEDAWQRFETARRTCDREAIDDAIAELRYAIEEMGKRFDAAGLAGSHSKVDRGDVARNLQRASERLEVMVTDPRSCPHVHEPDLLLKYPRRSTPPPPPPSPPPPPPP